MMSRSQICVAAVTLTALAMTVDPVSGLDDNHWHAANRSIDRGIAFLRSTQNEDGSWTPGPGPAITGLVLSVMLDRPDTSTSDPAVSRAIHYVLSKCQPDGGIHEGILENYNTAICLSALARVNDRSAVAGVIKKAQAYLQRLQWHAQTDPQGQVVGPDHPYFGGAGYGKHGRPDMSNTQIMLEGLYQSGLDCNDPVFRRAIAFITRCQGTKVNTELGEKINQDGGFIYATSINKDLVGVPQSMASPELIEAAKAGQPVHGLRTYGSMTYAGFKSYIYANLARDDQRVVDAYNWIRRHYTLDHNPGMPPAQQMQGYYYYLMTFSKALDAWGNDHIDTHGGGVHDWANDLIDKLTGLQRQDGSWANEADRWMEADTNLTTVYAVTALQHAIH